MLLFLKSISFRSLNHQDFKNNNSSCKELTTTTSSSLSSSSCIFLTVWRKSLIFSCKGFTVIGSDGNLVYRVDNYSGRRDQTILMDASGKPILTICRHKQKLRIVDNNWFIYEGEVLGDHDYKASSSRKKPIFCVKKQMKILHSNINVLAHVYYHGTSSGKTYSYIIEGSYANRTCKVLDAKSRNVVAEIRKKQAVIGGVTFGLEVFVLVVMPGFDSGFAMAMVLLLDQMFS
ncbi:hypothetical protein H5410_043801 [Solanum commersonii]|uniref:GTP binding protein n=1 Tax=Solanum commersonii TaxID=4109 RepID=A0A9J5Y0B4_SOLCO|nr:hypothetical protein H5410_043801 [Solanum commersonii]